MTQTQAPLTEKYIRQDERRKAQADGLLADPANLGFPARTQAEFDAAVIRLNSIGGTSSTRAARVKRNLIRIARKQGYTLPDAWKQDAGEAAQAVAEAADWPAVDSPLEDGESDPAAQHLHDLAVALGAPCPGLPWGYTDYFVVLATSPEGYVLRQLHEGTLDLGARCDPLDASLLESLQHTHEAGARHSAADQDAIQRAHDALAAAGAVCVPAAADGARPIPLAVEAAHRAARPRERVALNEGAGTAVMGVVAPAGVNTLRGEAVVRIIQPGFNSSQTRYYTPAAVRAIAEAMRNRKQYLDHATEAETRARPERSLTELASILTDTWVDPKDGAAYGKTAIVRPEFLSMVERLNATGHLEQLGASINAIGIGTKGEIEGVATFIVEDIDATDEFRSVDWVTEPGAGGRAVLVESANHSQNAGGQKMAETKPAEDDQAAEDKQFADHEKRIKALESTVAAHETTLGKMAAMNESLVRMQTLDGLLAAVRAPEAIKAKVRGQLLPGSDELTTARVNEAVLAESTYVRSVTGTGPTGMRGFGGPPAAEGGEDTQVDSGEIDALLTDLAAASGGRYDKRVLEGIAGGR